MVTTICVITLSSCIPNTYGSSKIIIYIDIKSECMQSIISLYTIQVRTAISLCTQYLYAMYIVCNNKIFKTCTPQHTHTHTIYYYYLFISSIYSLWRTIHIIIIIVWRIPFNNLITAFDKYVSLIIINIVPLESNRTISHTK